MSRVAKFMALPASDRALLFKSLVPLVAMRVGLWTMPYARVRRLADWMAGAGGSSLRVDDADAKPSRERIGWAVATVSRVVPDGINCLVRAMATEVMLKRFGYESTLKFGVVKPSEGQLEAHAWLESDGIVVIGEFELDRYVTLQGQDPTGR
jgi:Transglutaminase-like superfamily